MRKPGAFAHYRYREDLFPSLAFRQAYDALCKRLPQHADRHYVRVLHLAATTSESEVETAIGILLENSQVPTFDAVRDLVRLPQVPVLGQVSVNEARRMTSCCLPSRGGPMPNRQLELQTMLHSLRLPTMAEGCAELALKAAKEGLSHEAFLYELARLECERRSQQRIERLLAQSGLPREKTFATFQPDRFPMSVRGQLEQLRSGEFVKDAINVVAVGPPGVGKSHVLAAVAHDLVRQGYTVLWTSTAQLMQRLLAAKRDLRLPQELAKLHRYACLVLDDIGYVQHDRDEMEVLFTFLAERYERKSVMITTNLVFSEWQRIFKDPMTTLDVS